MEAGGRTWAMDLLDTKLEAAMKAREGGGDVEAGGVPSRLEAGRQVNVDSSQL
jgi:hypothetical protein